MLLWKKRLLAGYALNTSNLETVSALAAIRGQHYDVLRGTPRGRKPRLAAELAKAYLRGR